MKNINNSLSRLKYFVGLIFIVVLGTQCTTKSDALELVKSGKSDYKIYVSDKAIPSEEHAAKELQKYINEISDCKLPITNKYQETEKFVFVGFNDVPKNILQDIEVDSFGDEEYIIETAGSNILIAGGNPRGTLYGVTAFLTDYLGCRWYTPDFKKISKTKDIIANAINKRDKPVFEYREAWYKEAYNTEWAVHNRLNPSMSLPPDSMGGGYKIYPWAHTFYQLVPPDKYFKNHPEYFSLVNGKREGHAAQLCLTNPEVLKIATKTVFRWIKEQPDVRLLTVDQNDSYGFCECDNCKLIDDTEGSHSGSLLQFVNKIADTLSQTYPKIKVQTLAYQYSEIPPKNIKPRSNVTIRLCHMNYCAAHSLEGCDSHKIFRERLQAWNKITDHLTIWDYYTDFKHYLIPYPNFETIKNDVQYYADHGCIGLFAQGNNVPDNGGGEFSALRAWVLAQLMWNPYQNAQALIDEFIENVYGNASPYIKTYIKLMHEKVKPESTYFSLFDEPNDLSYLTPEIIQESVKLFQQAEDAVTNDSTTLKRVELAGLPILYTQLYFYTKGDKSYLKTENIPKILNKFERIINENNITMIEEDPILGRVDKFIEIARHEFTYLTNWWILGPFDNPEGNGLNMKYAPENEFSTGKSYLGKNNQSILWQHIENEEPGSGYIDFTKLFEDPFNGVAYARTSLELKQNSKINIGIGSNDGVKLWINGKLELTNQIARKAQPNQDKITVNMKKGKNDILIKIDQRGGGWGFYFTILNEN